MIDIVEASVPRRLARFFRGTDAGGAIVPEPLAFSVPTTSSCIFACQLCRRHTMPASRAKTSQKEPKQTKCEPTRAKKEPTQAKYEPKRAKSNHTPKKEPKRAQRVQKGHKSDPKSTKIQLKIVTSKKVEKGGSQHFFGSFLTYVWLNKASKSLCE